MTEIEKAAYAAQATGLILLLAALAIGPGAPGPGAREGGRSDIQLSAQLAELDASGVLTLP